MITVWILTHWTLSGDEEETKVIGAFSSHDLAKSHVEKIKGYPANNDFFINPFEIDILV